MTFYSILYSILFISSFSNFVMIVISKEDLLSAMISLILCLIIINDTIYSSHQLDKDPNKYLLPMKFIDLLNFFVLSIALILISPKNNIFVGNLGVVPDFLKSGYRIVLIWLSLIFYFSISIVWDFLLYKYEIKVGRKRFFNWFGENGLFQIISISLCLFLIVLSLLSACVQKEIFKLIECYISIICAVVLLVYIAIYKPTKFKNDV